MPHASAHFNFWVAQLISGFKMWKLWRSFTYLLLSDHSLRNTADISLAICASDKSTSFYRGQAWQSGTLLEYDFHVQYGCQDRRDQRYCDKSITFGSLNEVHEENKIIR